METWFELWDSENASLVGSYDTQTAALQVVRKFVETGGAESIATLVLVRETDSDDDPCVLGSGDQLAGLLVQAPAHHSSV